MDSEFRQNDPCRFQMRGPGLEPKSLQLGTKDEGHLVLMTQVLRDSVNITLCIGSSAVRSLMSGQSGQPLP